jgi:hypothetical protein
MKIRSLANYSAAATCIGLLAIVTGGLGVAAAVDGGSLTLGQHNSASTTTTLADTKGTPLSLVAKAGKPPLKVNSSGLVKHLNAELVGGLSAQQLQTTASAAAGELVVDGNTPLLTVILPIAPTGPDGPQLDDVLIARTATLKAGSYVVSASATGDNALCYVDTAPNTSKPHEFGATGENGTATMDSAAKLTKPGRLKLYCSDPSSDPGGVISAGITAISVASVARGHATVGTVSDN